jgi:hypothetical protein
LSNLATDCLQSPLPSVIFRYCFAGAIFAPPVGGIGMMDGINQLAQLLDSGFRRGGFHNRYFRQSKEPIAVTTVTTLRNLLVDIPEMELSFVLNS